MTKLKKDDSAMSIKLRELNKKIKETFLETKDEKKLKILPNTGISVNSFISTGFILLTVASIIRKKKNYI